MIYVHDNPQGLEFNALVYVFQRSWYCPELDNHKFTGDTWFKVPAIRVETRDSVSYTPINSKMEMTAMMMVSDAGMLLRANRTRLQQKVAQHQLIQIEQQAFDIPAWEKINQRSFPYELAHNGKEVQARYRAVNGTSTEAYFSIASENLLFTEIKKVVSPKPCNCGKPQYVG